MKKERGILGFSLDKKGQVTIFIIIAIHIIGIAALIFFVIPKTKTTTGFDAQSPRAFIQSCMENRIKDVVSALSAQGGSLEPEFYFTYNNINIEYLCYVNEPNKLCIVQQPLLKQHIESDIKDEISDETETCFANLAENYGNEGYSAQLQTGRTEVELLPKRIVVDFRDYVLTVTKGDTVRHETFNVILNNNLYELISIAKSIIEWEATVGEADPRIYMTYYPDLNVNKNLRSDGTRIYSITDLNTGNEFRFASRSLVSLPGH